MGSKENKERTLFGLAHLPKTSFWSPKEMLHTGKVELATVYI